MEKMLNGRCIRACHLADEIAKLTILTFYISRMSSCNTVTIGKRHEKQI
jgi:hypothetical protein